MILSGNDKLSESCLHFGTLSTSLLLSICTTTKSCFLHELAKTTD